jgi:sugar-specific transcriptional regulator TrmB
LVQVGKTIKFQVHIIFKIVPKLAVLIVKEQEYLQTLMDLGLTLLQSKIYLALSRLEKAKVASISTSSNVVREDIYRIMPQLEKIGLVEKIVDRPNLYTALPLKEGLTLLIQERKEESYELEKKTRGLMQNLEYNHLRKAFQEENDQFVITSSLKLFRKRFEKYIQAAQSRVDVILSSKVLKGMLFHHSKCLQSSMAQGLKIRVLIEKAKERKEPIDIEAFEKNSLFVAKHVFVSAPITMALFDEKEVSIRISKDLVPSLWSNNPEIVQLAASYFNEMWNKAE